MRSLVLLGLPFCLYGQIKNGDINLLAECNKKEVVVGECFNISYYVIVDSTLKIATWKMDGLTVVRGVASSKNLVLFEKGGAKPYREKFIKDGRVEERIVLYSFSICPLEKGKILIPPLTFQFFRDYDSPAISKLTNSFPINVTELGLPSVSEFIGKPMVGDFEIEESILNLANFEANGYIDYKLAISGYGDLFGFDVPSLSDSLIEYSVSNSKLSYEFFANDLWTKREIDIRIRPKQKSVIDLDKYFKWNFYSLNEAVLKSLAVNSVLRVPNASVKSVHSAKLPELIVLVDISESMQLEDYPVNRMNEAMKVVRRIEVARRVKVLAFSGDFHWLLPNQRDTSVIQLPKIQGTALCDALWEAIGYINKNTFLNKEIIVIGDGDDTSSHLSQEFIGAQAAQLGIKIHSIAIGHAGKVRFGHDFFGRERFVEDVFNSETLKSISSRSGGQFHHLDRSDQLEEIINGIISF